MSMLKLYITLFLPVALVLTTALGITIQLGAPDWSIFVTFALFHILTTYAGLAATKTEKAFKTATLEGGATFLASFVLSMALGLTLMLLLSATSTDPRALFAVGVASLGMLGAAGGLDKPIRIMMAGVFAYMVGLLIMSGLFTVFSTLWVSDGSWPRLAFGILVMMPMLSIPAVCAAYTRKRFS